VFAAEVVAYLGEEGTVDEALEGFTDVFFLLDSNF